MRNPIFYGVAFVALAAVCGATFAQAAKSPAKSPDSGKPGSIERGRYLARTAGCNDCHTPGYPQSGGTVPEDKWLIGDPVGFQGPWGTTYPPNLRLSLAKMSEKEWIEFARKTQLRPPMPWFALRDMTTDDLRAIYKFVKHLGPGGEAAPAYVPPGKTPAGPVIKFPG
jgi:mono/diheme cytochrome c family protein